MKVVIKPGEPLTIQFETEQGGVDGEFEIHFDTLQHPSAIVVKETAGLSGSLIGGASAILYHEAFGPTFTLSGEEVSAFEEEFIDGEVQDKVEVIGLEDATKDYGTYVPKTATELDAERRDKKALLRHRLAAHDRAEAQRIAAENLKNNS